MAKPSKTSRSTESRRAVVAAARRAGAASPGLENVSDIVEAVEAEIEWTLDDEEKHLAVATYRLAIRGLA